MNTYANGIWEQKGAWRDGVINLFPRLRSEGRRKCQRNTKKVCVCVLNPLRSAAFVEELSWIVCSFCLFSVTHRLTNISSTSVLHTHTHTQICWCIIFLYFSGRSAYPCSRDSLCLHPRGIYITYIYSACLCVELMETDMRADMDTELCCTGPCGLTQQQG